MGLCTGTEKRPHTFQIPYRGLRRRTKASRMAGTATKVAKIAKKPDLNRAKKRFSFKDHSDVDQPINIMEDIEITSNRASFTFDKSRNDQSSFTFDKNRNDQPTDSNRGIITKDTEIEGEIKKFIQEKIEMLYKGLQADFTHKLENIMN